MSRREQPYIPLYVQDFLTDEKLNECSAESTGVYIRLMCLMHKSHEYGVILLKQKDKQNPKQNASNVTDFANKLVKHMPYDVATIERSLHELLEEEVIYIDGDRLCQKRMIKDGEISSLRASAGSKGGKKKAQKKEFANSFATDFAIAKSQATVEIENEYENENENEVKNKTDITTDDKKILEDRFDIFWSLYPRKVGKGQAKKMWFKISPSEELYKKILSAVEEAKNCRQWKTDGGQYIPYPSTWLNQERWEDDYADENKRGEDSENEKCQGNIYRRKYTFRPST